MQARQSMPIAAEQGPWQAASAAALADCRDQPAARLCLGSGIAIAYCKTSMHKTHSMSLIPFADGPGLQPYTGIPSQWWFGGGTDITPSYLYPEDMRHFHSTYKARLSWGGL